MSRVIGIAVAVALIWGPLIMVPGVDAAVIAYEWNEGGPGNGVNSNQVSAHGPKCGPPLGPTPVETTPTNCSVPTVGAGPPAFAHLHPAKQPGGGFGFS